MTLTRPLLLSGTVVAAMSAASAWAATRVGDRLLPVHFGLNGPDNYQPAAVALWTFPALAVAVTALFAALPALMRRTGRLERSQGAYQTVWLTVLMVLALTEASVIAAALGAVPDPQRLVMGGVGALLIVMGNLMGKIRYNFVFGVRTPWTLANERVWDKTHRFIGPWFMAWGATVLAATLLAPGNREVLRYALIGGGGLTVALAFIYSYLAARRLDEA